MVRKLGVKTQRLIAILKESQEVPRTVLLQKHKFTKGELDCRIPDFEKKGWIKIIPNFKTTDARSSVYRWIAKEEVI